MIVVFTCSYYNCHNHHLHAVSKSQDKSCVNRQASSTEGQLLSVLHSIDQIQRRAARWVLQNYNRYSSVTSMQQQPNWSTLQRRQRSRLVKYHHP